MGGGEGKGGGGGGGGQSVRDQLDWGSLIWGINETGNQNSQNSLTIVKSVIEAKIASPPQSL